MANEGADHPHSVQGQASRLLMSGNDIGLCRESRNLPVCVVICPTLKGRRSGNFHVEDQDNKLTYNSANQHCVFFAVNKIFRIVFRKPDCNQDKKKQAIRCANLNHGRGKQIAMGTKI